MNMIFHGVEAPNIMHTNTLAEDLSQIQQRDRKDVILANPPFGGKERSEIQQNFPIKTGETAYLFMEHFIKMLKAGGRASNETAHRLYQKLGWQDVTRKPHYYDDGEDAIYMVRSIL